jgi:hypothetical protein
MRRAAGELAPSLSPAAGEIAVFLPGVPCGLPSTPRRVVWFSIASAQGLLGVPVVILSGASAVLSGAQRISQAGKQSSNGRGVPCSAP